MSGNLSNRVERRFLEIEERLRKAGRGKEVIPDKLVMPVSKIISYADDQIDRYEHHLNEIMRNVREARSSAPCSGCKKTVETIKITTLGALTALSVYKAMQSEGRNRADISDEEIERIKKEVESKYSNY